MEKAELDYYFNYMYNDEIGSTVYVYKDGSLKVTDYTDDIIRCAFGTWGNEATIQDLEKFYESRCFPRSRANCRELLEAGGFDFYDPFAICVRTQGRMSDDRFWIDFHFEDGEINN